MPSPSDLTTSLRWLTRFFLPNAIFTLLIVSLVLTYQQVTAQTGEKDSLSNPPLVTSTFAYQGFLTNATGQPINGNRALTFSLYSVPSGGQPLWTEIRNGQGSVVIENGLFDVRLGEITPIPPSVWDTPALYLGVKVEAESELSPREPIGLVPVAQRAITADQAELALTVPDGSITSEKLNPTLNFIPAPNKIFELTLEMQPIMTTTITVDTPSKIWFTQTVDAQIREGALIFTTYIDGVEQSHQVVLVSIGVSNQFTRSVGSSMHVVDLAPGTHEIVLNGVVSVEASANTEGFIYGENSGITYMVVSQ